MFLVPFPMVQMYMYRNVAGIFVLQEYVLINRNHFGTAKLLKQGICKFYRRHSELIDKYLIGLQTLLQQGLSEMVFYGLFSI